jgi:hypothetical protein
MQNRRKAYSETQLILEDRTTFIANPQSTQTSIGNELVVRVLHLRTLPVAVLALVSQRSTLLSLRVLGAGVLLNLCIPLPAEQQ